MSELPDYFEYLLENPKDEDDDRRNLYPFSYDERTQAFSVGSISISAIDFDPDTFNEFQVGINGRGVEVSQLSKQYLVLGPANRPLATPKLHNYAKNNPSWPTHVIRVMVDTYRLFASDIHEITVVGSDVGHIGFTAGNRESEGKFQGLHLQVLGNCACSGPNLHGFVRGLEYDYAEYDLHNTDDQAQRTSIYAGLGHLAQLAEVADIQLALPL